MNTKFLLPMIVMSILLTSCKPRTNFEASNDFTQMYPVIRASNVDDLSEIESWKLFNEKIPISLLQYNNILNRVTAANENFGQVSKLSVTTGNEDIYQIQFSSLKLLDVDAEGDNLLIAEMGTISGKETPLQEYFNWIALWEINTSTIKRCFWGSCYDSLNDSVDPDLADIGGLLDGDTIIVFSENGYSVESLAQENEGASVVINDIEGDYWWHIGNMASNSLTDKLAVVFQEGRVVLRKIYGANIWSAGRRNLLAEGIENENIPIHDVAFDSQGKWLALAIEDKLIIWKVKGIRHKVVQIEIDNIQDIEFCSSGDLLFVAGKNEMSVVDITDSDIIYTAPTNGITVIEISEDNRVLFWGDDFGFVHAWTIIQ